MCRRKTIFSILAVLFITSLFGQKLQKKGWLLTNQGDTLLGVINVSEWNKNPNKIIFNNGVEKRYSVSEIQAFGVNSEDLLYERYTIEKHLVPINDNLEIPEDETKTDTATVWLKILVRGKIPLGEFTDNERSYYYYIKDKQPKELLYWKGIKKFNKSTFVGNGQYANTFLTDNPEFKKQLFTLNVSEKDLGDIGEKINNAEYSSFSLTDIFLTLNKTKKEKSNKNNNHLFLGVGASVISTTTIGNSSLFDFNTNINTASSIIFKIGYELKSNKANSKISFVPELGFATYNTTGTKPTSSSNGIKYVLKNTWLTSSLNLKFTFNPYDKLKFSIYGGAGTLLSISSSNQVEENTYSGYVIVTSNTPKFKNFIVSPIIGANVSFKRGAFFIDYRSTPNLTTLQNTEYRLNMIFTGITYNLN